MKKQLIKMITVLAVSSVLFSGCMISHRQQRGARTHDKGDNRGHYRDHNNYNRDRNDHYNKY